jgi:hypothetical protein
MTTTSIRAFEQEPLSVPPEPVSEPDGPMSVPIELFLGRAAGASTS